MGELGLKPKRKSDVLQEVKRRNPKMDKGLKGKRDDLDH